VGDTRRLVEGGDAGWLVPPDDPTALARALTELVEAPEETLASMGRTGSEFVRREYSAAKLAERTLEVYEEVMGAKGSNRS
jgi:glycosyltransferase involved in cell wall biosynthesis